MPYTVSYNDTHQIAELRFRDSASIKEHIDSRRQVIEICRNNKVAKVLVHFGNLVAQNTMSKKEQFEFTKSWDEEILNKIFFAVVMPENIESQNEFYFMVHMSKMKGVIMKSFYDEEQAIGWLITSTG